jgi:hypothetical protein
MLGGIAGVLAMRTYWRTTERVLGYDPRKLSRPPGQTVALDSIALFGEHRQEGESSTAAVGRLAYQKVTGREPGAETRQVLSYLVHWVISLAMSGLYGAVRGRSKGLDPKGGAVLGSGLWLLGDELAMPLLGVAKGPTAVPPAVHGHAWAAHLAYGTASAAATQLLYRLF